MNEKEIKIKEFKFLFYGFEKSYTDFLDENLKILTEDNAIRPLYLLLNSCKIKSCEIESVKIINISNKSNENYINFIAKASKMQMNKDEFAKLLKDACKDLKNNNIARQCSDVILINMEKIDTPLTLFLTLAHELIHFIEECITENSFFLAKNKSMKDVFFQYASKIQPNLNPSLDEHEILTYAVEYYIREKNNLDDAAKKEFKEAISNLIKNLT